jgi:hypothetical protein
MIFQDYPVFNYQFVTIQVNTASVTAKQYFPDLPNLRNVQTLGIVAYHANIFAKDNNNVSLVTIEQFLYSALTLTVNNEEIIQNMDLQCFNPIVGNNVQYNPFGMLPLKGQRFDFSKSYVTITSGQTGSASPIPYSYAFGIYYVK